METEEQKLLNSSNSSITALVPGGVVTTQNISTVIRPKGNSNSLQFVKIQTPELSKKAVEQIRIADETKISKEKIKEVEEEWQNNLLNWKSKRRQQLNHNVDLEPDQSLDNNNDCGTRKVKTFAEMIEQRAKSGNRLSFHLQRYVGTDEDGNDDDDDDHDEKKEEDEGNKKEVNDDDEEGEEDDDDGNDDDGGNQNQNGDNEDQKKDGSHTSNDPVRESSLIIDPPPPPPTSQTTMPVIKQAPKPILRSPSPVKQASPTTLQPSSPVKHSPLPAKEIPQAADRTPIHLPVVQPSPPTKQSPSSKVQASPPVKQTSTILVQASHPVKQTVLPVKPTPPPNKPVHPPVMRIFPPFKQTTQPIVQSPPPPLVTRASQPIIQTPPSPPTPPVKQVHPPIKQTQSFVTQNCPVVKQQAPSPVIRTSTPLIQTSPTVDQTPPPVLRNCPPVKHTSPPSTHSSPLRTPSISPKSEQNVVDAFPPEVTPPSHKPQPKTNREDKDRTVLSVSGKKRCSSCKEELGRGAAAFVVESLSLVYHTNCFRCSVCHMNLSNGFRGVDVRVHAGALHCQNCYSKDGLSYSRV